MEGGREGGREGGVKENSNIAIAHVPSPLPPSLPAYLLLRYPQRQHLLQHQTLGAAFLQLVNEVVGLRGREGGREGGREREKEGRGEKSAD